VPTGIVGTNRIQPPGARVPRPFGPAVIRFGAPIDPSDVMRRSASSPAADNCKESR
jgi:hypothetical protein